MSASEKIFKSVQETFTGIKDVFSKVGANGVFVFVFILFYMIFTVTQAFTNKLSSSSMSPIQINTLFGLSLLLLLQFVFRRFAGKFTMYENVFATSMTIAATIGLALLFTLGNKMDESIQISSIITCAVFIFTFYAYRYYGVVTDDGSKNPTSDALFRAILFSSAIGVFVLGLTREYSEPDTSFALDDTNEIPTIGDDGKPAIGDDGKPIYEERRTKRKNPNGTNMKTGDIQMYQVPVFIYLKGDRYVGNVIKYDTINSSKKGKGNKTAKGILVEYEDKLAVSTDVKPKRFIPWTELRTKGSTLIIHRKPTETGECATYDPIVI